VKGAADAFGLQRFVDAQDPVFEVVIDELRAGEKRTHWMWFIFPQLAGLGRSQTARYYGIRTLGEARAYFGHPVLGPRLSLSVESVLRWAGKRDAAEILGPIDAMKLRSSLTLFEAATGNAVFARALDAFFAGRRDEATLRLLGND